MDNDNAVHNNTNSTSNSSSSIIFTKMAYHVFVTTFVTLLVAIILGNSLVLMANWFNKNLFKQGGCYLVSLAVADMLVGLLVVGRLYMFIFGRVFLCIPLIWLEIFCETASIVTLTVISIDRYYKISYPFRYKVKVTTRRCVYVVAVVWFYSAVFAMFGVLPYNGEIKIHWSAVNGCSNPEPVYYLLDFTVCFAVPCVILMITYVLIFLTAYRRRRTWATQNATVDVTEQCMLSKDLKNARTLAIVVLTFILCWGPYFLKLVVFSGYSADLYKICAVAMHPYFSSVIHVFLPMAHSCCNPVIYALKNREYRNSFKKIFQKIFRKQIVLGS